jgi:transposase
MRAIPLPIRERILLLYEQEKTTREIAVLVGFSVAAVRRVRQQYEQRRTLQPQTHLCGRHTLLTVARKARLLALLTRQPDATLAELGAGLDRPFGPSTVDLWLRQLGGSHKKSPVRHRASPSQAAWTPLNPEAPDLRKTLERQLEFTPDDN